jgi:hypothetical protein
LITLIERDYGGNEVHAVFTRDYYRAFPLHESHERIRGSEINADDAVRNHLFKVSS